MDSEQLITEIARVTGLRITTSDRIMAAAVVNEILLDEALVKLDRQVKTQVDRVTMATTASVEIAKVQAEAIVTKSGEWAVTQIKAVNRRSILGRTQFLCCAAGHVAPMSLASSTSSLARPYI